MAATTRTIKYNAWASLTPTNLAGLASSQTAGWLSQCIDNTSNNYIDAIVTLKIPMQSGTAANDKNFYVYVVPWAYDGTNYYVNQANTGTLPGSSDATYTIAYPNQLFQGMAMPSAASSSIQTLEGSFNIVSTVGFMPQLWSLIGINYTGTTVNATAGNLTVGYVGLTEVFQ